MRARRASGRRQAAVATATKLCMLALLAASAACTSVSAVPSSRGSRAAAPSQGQAQVHVVRRGETLYQIAWQYRVDQRDLVRWNGIRDPDVIQVGQRLRLTPPQRAATEARAPPPSRSPSAQRVPSSTPAPSAPQPAAQPPPLWLWPTEGRVVTRFGGTGGIPSGVGIGGREGQAVRAAAAGRVVYAGSGLIGYGQLVILKHNETYLSAYGHNSRLLVTQGQDIARGATIAFMGQGPERQPRLHFEIRRNGVPVDPLLYLEAPR